MITVQHGLDDLSDALFLYKTLSGKSWEDVMKKQGGKLGFAINRRLRGLAPKRGEIRKALIAHLEGGGGIIVREGVRKKVADKRSRSKTGRFRLNAQAEAVKMEISLRERARGFMGVSGKYPRELLDENRAMSRHGVILSQVKVFTGEKRENHLVRFKWDPADSKSAGSATEGLNTPEGQKALVMATRDVKDDIEIYTNRKQQEIAKKAFKGIMKLGPKLL